MIIGEAIECLEHVKQRARREGNMGTYDAAQLGIEALKWVGENRTEMEILNYGLLPGETKE